MADLNAEEELKYTHRLNLHSYEYEPGVRAGVLGKLLGKDKGDLVYWYDTYTEGYVEVTNAGRRKEEAILSNQRRSTWKNTRIFYLKN